MRRGVFAFIVLLAAGPQDEPTSVPAKASATVDDADLARRGAFVVHLTFEPQDAVKIPYSVRLEVRAGGNVILSRDHVPTPPTAKWTKGKTVRYDVAATFPLDADLGNAATLDVYLGFLDSKSGRTLPPVEPEAGGDGMARVATMARPAFTPTEDPAQIDALVTEAEKLRKDKQGPRAWELLETAIRLSQSDANKKRLGRELLKISDYEPEPITPVEQTTVAALIDEEKNRYFRLVAGRMFDAGEFAGALRLLEIVGGVLENQAETAVIGAVNDAKRAKQDITRVEQAILKQISDDEKKIADDEIKKLGLTAKLQKAAAACVAAKKFAIARRLLTELCSNGPEELHPEAEKALLEVEATMLKETPPEQQAKVDAAVHHPVWARTATGVGHQFIYIGPKDLVASMPPESKRRFDVAYVFLTDFFGRKPNPGGDRVTVYFKELWNFGGATGGGTQINVGNANPEARGTRVDTALFYHELTHCIDDFAPDYEGFHEGLAELGAAFGLEAVGDDADSKATIKRYLDAFKKDYLDRDLDYWRIPRYAPSAGFFVHFVDAHGKAADGTYEWQRFRRFFRGYRDAPFRDGREPNVVRAIAFYLVQAFGPKAFDDLCTFRFPLHADDRDAIQRELETYARGLRPLRKGEFDAYKDFTNSPAPWDAAYAQLIAKLKSATEDETRAFSRERLGIVHTWIITGPFGARDEDPDVVVFPPEYEIDFSKTYQGSGHMCQWMKPDPSKPAKIDATGWVEFGFTYRENVAFYALANVYAARDMDAVAHVRADDDVTLWVGDALQFKYGDRGWNNSTPVNWRGPVAKAPDAMRWPIRLREGRNKILVKIANRAGDSGFILAITDAAGKPIAGMKTDAEAPAPEEVSKKPRPVKTILEFAKAGPAMEGAFADAVGGFEIKNARLVGKSAARGVPWRKYTVRPGFPKDSPSNLAWLRENVTKELDDFRLDLAVDTADGAPPKLCITFQGEGDDDPLSGWSLTIHPAGESSVIARVEKYDGLVYATLPIDVKKEKPPVKPPGKSPAKTPEPPAVELTPLHIILEDARLTVKLGETMLFDRTPIRPIPGKRRIGLTTWDANTRIAALALRAILPEK